MQSMNSDMTYETSTLDLKAVSRLANLVAKHLYGGDVLELVGDLGTGKTTFVQLLLEGLGYDGDASSPTFTVHRRYPITDGKQVHHLDFYRIGGQDVVTQEVQELMGQPGEIVCIEWADQGAGELPKKRLRIELEYGESQDERVVKVGDIGGDYPGLIQELQNVFGT